MGKRDRSLVSTALWLPISLTGGTTARTRVANGGGVAGAAVGRAISDAAVG